MFLLGINLPPALTSVITVVLGEETLLKPPNLQYFIFLDVKQTYEE